MEKQEETKKYIQHLMGMLTEVGVILLLFLIVYMLLLVAADLK